MFEQFIVIFFAETLGNTLFMFVGCLGSISLYQNYPLNGLIWGCALAIGIQVCLRLSGGHLNSGVSIAAVIMGQIKYYMFPYYILGQIAGSVLGSVFALVLTFNDRPQYNEDMNFTASYKKECSTLPDLHNINLYQAFLIEFLITSILICSWCSFWDKRNVNNYETFPLRIGLVMAGLCMISMPLSGGSLSMTRSAGPRPLKIYELVQAGGWIYFVAPNLAGLVWASLYRLYYICWFTYGPPEETVFIVEKTEKGTETFKPYPPSRKGGFVLRLLKIFN